MNKVVAVKYPIILVHGIVAHDRGGLIHFWGRIPERLKEGGFKVYSGNTDAWGDYDSNSYILKKTIEQVQTETGSERVNIIAHSKGGIDARYYIWKYNRNKEVASLTTICTPHQGSEIADLIYRQKITHSRVVHKTLQIFGKLYGDINPDLVRTNNELTTTKMADYNRIIVPDPSVFYHSMYSTMRNSFDDLIFFYSHWYLKSVAGPNDGVVSQRSTQWGSLVSRIPGGISHGEILDIKRRRISGRDIPGIYLSIARDLGDRGF